MHSASDLTRWPALDLAAKRARLQTTLHLTPGPLTDALSATSAAAERAAGALWRHDPAGWSADAAVQKKIADRLGWLTSPSLMADSIDRLLAFAAAGRPTASATSCCSAWVVRAWRPVIRAVLGVAPGWPRFHMLDSTDPAAVRPRPRRPKHRST
jgi:hypothetical protein